MVMRGPGVPAGSTFEQIASNVDLSPTMLSIAGVTPPPSMDGKSFLPFVIKHNAKDPLPATVARYVHEHSTAAAGSSWRQCHFIQHHRVGAGSYCGPNHHIDGMDNNYIAVRYLNHPTGPFHNLLYAEFQWANGTDYGEGNVDFESPFFFELYDMDKVSGLPVHASHMTSARCHSPM